jgi:hypothetical protein
MAEPLTFGPPIGDVLIDNLVEPPAQPGAFKRGLGAGMAGVKSSLYGAGALAARGAANILPDAVAPVAQDLEQAALENVAAQNEIAASQSMRVEDVVEDPSRAWEFAKWGVGSAVPSLALMAIGGIAGRGLGALAGRAMAPAAAATAKTAGMYTGAVVPDVAVEAGSIYPEALESGVEDPATRALVGGAAAGAVDFIALPPALRALLPAARKIGKGGVGAVVSEVARRAPKVSALEGAQELTQTFIERAAAGQALDTPEAISGYINSATIGALAGGTLGGAAGVFHGARGDVQDTGPSTNREQALDVNVPDLGTNVPDLGTPIPPVTPEEQFASLTAEHATATEQLATLEPALAQAQAAHDEAVARRDALTAENVAAKDTAPGTRRARNVILAEKKAAQKAVESTKAALEAAGGSVFAARSAVADIGAKLAGFESSLQNEGTSEQVPPVSDPAAEAIAAATEAPTDVAPAVQPAPESSVPDTVAALDTHALAKEAIASRQPGVTPDQAIASLNLGDVEHAAVQEKFRSEAVQKAQAYLQQQGAVNLPPTETELRQGRIAAATAEDIATLVKVKVDSQVKGSKRKVNVAKTTAKLTETVNSEVERAMRLPSSTATKAEAAKRWVFKAVRGSMLKEDAETLAAGIAGKIESGELRSGRETVTPSSDTSVGQNVAGEVLYDRPDGSRYRMHAGRPTFGGDLAVSGETGTQFSKGAVTTPVSPVERAEWSNLEQGAIEGKLTQHQYEKLLWFRTRDSESRMPRFKQTQLSKGAMGPGVSIKPSLMKEQSTTDVRAGYASFFKNPVHLAGDGLDGMHISGFSDPVTKTTFHGYDKNGERFTIRAALLKPENIVSSRDSNRTANSLRDAVVAHQEQITARESRAALTPDEFDNLPEPAKFAAVEEFNRAWRARGTELRNRIKEMLGDRSGLIMKTFMATPGSPIGSFTRVDTAKAVISMALNAKDELSIADHEGYHAAESLILKDAEVQIITNALKPSRPIRQQLVQKLQQYDRENGTTLTDEVTAIPAEARAYAYEFWRRGELQAEGPLLRAWQKLQQFFERIANLVRGLGFTSMEDIFTALDRGQFAERETNNGGAEAVLASESNQQGWYYSALTKAIDVLPTKAASVQGWKDQIKGLVAKGAVKQVELDAVGLNEFLDLQQGKVTKDQVLAFLGENGVRVEETVLGETAAAERAGRGMAEAQGHVWDDLSQADQRRYIRTAGGESIAARPEGTPKFASYQLPGGQNYRELLLRLPPQDQAKQELHPDEVEITEPRNKDIWVATAGRHQINVLRRDAPTVFEAQILAARVLSRMENRSPNNEFRSSHFDQPNILAHIRFNERTDAEGKRVLFIEEIQSDWAQKGKKEGFVDSDAAKTLNVELLKYGVVLDENTSVHKLTDAGVPVELRNRWYEVNMKAGTIPTAPFVTSTPAWVALSLKRMIRYAAENGFDKVAWTTGEQQFERYGSELIAWERQKGASVPTWKVHASEQHGGNAGGIDIEGEARARGILKEERGVQVLSKGDLRAQVSRVLSRENNQQAIDKVTDRVWERMQKEDAGTSLPRREGMKKFYDEMVPNITNDVLRKLGGGKVGTVDISLDHDASANEQREWNESVVRSILGQGGEVYLVNQHGQETGVSNPVELNAEINDNGTPRAYILGDKQGKRIQPAFTLTPELADRAAAGIPLFSRGATADLPPALAIPAMREMTARFQAGELEQDQYFAAVTRMMDEAKSELPATRDMVKALGTESVGAFQRARTYISTGNYIGKSSKGYKNALGALAAQERFKERLVVDGSEIGMSAWHAATQDDRITTFDALLKRTIGGFLKGSKEFNDLYTPLNPAQRKMFEQVAGTANEEGIIAKFLRMEFDAETKRFREYMTPKEFESWQTERGASVQGLIDNGYVPLRRFGDHTVRVLVDVALPDGSTKSVTVALEGHESGAGAARSLLQYQDEIKRTGAAIRVEQGIRHSAERDTDLSIQQVFDLTRRQGIKLTQSEIEKLSRALLSADSIRRNRLMRRQNIPGYSRDGWRVLNEFVTGMAGRIAHAEFSPAVNAALDGRPVEAGIDEAGAPAVKIDMERDLWAEDGAKSGFYRDLADKRADMVLTPQDSSVLSTRLKAAAMSFFIGGSLGGGVVQMFAVPLNALPYLSQHTPYGNAFSTTLASWQYTLRKSIPLRDINTLRDLDKPIEGLTPELRQALIAAHRDGTTASTEIHQIMGISRGSMLSQSRTVQRAMEVWMAPFKFGENTSRIASFIAAWRIATEGDGVALKQADGTYAAPRRLGGKELYDFAKNAVDETNNRYDPVNRPAIASHPIGSLLFMFKSFPLFMVEMIETMYKQNPKSAVYALAGLVALTGVQGLPFAEDIMDLIDVISQKVFGSPFQVKRAMRNIIKDASKAMVGVDLSNLFLRGLINDWMNANMATRVGMGDMLPGTRLGAADTDYARLAEQLLGAPISMVVSVGGQIPNLVGGVLKGDFDQVMAALRAGGPVAVRNAIKGYEQFESGFAQDARGNNVTDVSGMSALFQAMGVSSGVVSKMYDMDSLDKQRNAFYSQAGAELQNQLVRALREGDSDKVREIYEARAAWNDANPEMRMMPNPAATRRAIMLAGLPLNARTLALMPRALRGSSIAGEVE